MAYRVLSPSAFRTASRSTSGILSRPTPGKVSPVPVLPSKDDVLSVLRGVVDPELGSDIVDLGMVREIDVGDDGTVTATVVLTISGCPLRTQIKEDVESKLRGLPGVREARGECGVGHQQERS